MRKYLILALLVAVTFVSAQSPGTGAATDAPAGAADAQSASDDGAEDFATMGKEIADLWGESACVAEQTTKYENTVLSIACNAEYQGGERDKMLDYLFRKGYLFRGESYDVKGTTGHYWYKFERKDGYRMRPVFIRLHIKSQGTLWGAKKPPAQIAVYVDFLATADELTAWQTLGIPVTFGLKPTDTAKDLAQQIEEYKQESWLSLDLKQATFSAPDQSASMRDVIEQDLITPYVKTSLEQTGDVWGFVIRDINRLTTTVATARAVFNAIKGEGKSFVLLPARYNHTLTTTANLMGMTNRRVTYDMTAMCSKSPDKIWKFLKSKAGAGGVIARFPASYKKCAHRLSRTIKRSQVEFKTLSSFFGYRPDPAAAPASPGN